MLLGHALHAGANVLGRVLSRVGSGRRKDPLVCSCGAAMESHGLISKSLTTLLGVIPYQRSLYVCPNCKTACFPGDQLLDIENTGFSPGVRRRMAHAASRGSFLEAEEDLLLYSRIHVHRRDIERISEQIGRQIEFWQLHEPPEDVSRIPIMYISFDGTGTPIRRQELKGRKGKQKDGSAKGREVKVGCVFTQTGVNENGFPVRDENSTSIVTGIESSMLFGERIYREAVRRGIDQAKLVVVLSDGAAYNKTIVQTHFPNALHIIDLYHAREHLYKMAALLLPNALHENKLEKRLELLDQGKVETLTAQARGLMPRSGSRRKDALKEIGYFEKNAHLMRYARFRQQGLFIGSGVVESICRTAVGLRLKRPGMFWSTRGAHAILQLRCCLLSNRFNDFWEQRIA